MPNETNSDTRKRDSRDKQSSSWLSSLSFFFVVFLTFGIISAIGLYYTKEWSGFDSEIKKIFQSEIEHDNDEKVLHNRPHENIHVAPEFAVTDAPQQHIVTEPLTMNIDGFTESEILTQGDNRTESAENALPHEHEEMLRKPDETPHSGSTLNPVVDDGEGANADSIGKERNNEDISAMETRVEVADEGTVGGNKADTLAAETTPDKDTNDSNEAIKSPSVEKTDAPNSVVSEVEITSFETVMVEGVQTVSVPNDKDPKNVQNDQPVINGNQDTTDGITSNSETEQVMVTQSTNIAGAVKENTMPSETDASEETSEIRPSSQIN